MAAGTEDLIDFTAIEGQKENIQSIPGGRSAKQLSSICSPLAAKKSPALSETQNLKDTMRRQYEDELALIGEADDPLDIYDRYVKWTMDAYPSAQGTSESNLLPLLERATRAFLNSTHYKNDPRYLKLWLLYIRLFSDSPRETYAFLAKHKVGQNLALFYEEFAAWLENAGRWVQAEEVYLSGIDTEARPQERLIRKFGEFQHRRETKSTASDGPSSPAMPRIRPALAAKLDPFASAAEEADPQARDRAAAAAASRASKSGKQKMSIFADEDEPQKPGSSDGGSGWDAIGSIKERKKENTREAKPWVGETLDGGRRLASGPRMMIFKDQYTFNPKTGRNDYVFSNLEMVYPSGDAESGYEFCFEELRAMARGLIDPAGHIIPSRKKLAGSPKCPRMEPSPKMATSPRNIKAHSAKKLDIFQDTETSKVAVKIPVFNENDENAPAKAAMKIPIFDDSNQQTQSEQEAATKAARRAARREEKANRTRKIAVMEVKAEPQTVQTNLNSPAGPKIKRKKSAEPTMTLHTKEAMSDVYDLFNQTLTKVEDEDETQSQDSDEDDYTSGGESTTTGRFSATMSDNGDETANFTITSRTDGSVGDSTGQSGWSEFTEVKHLPATDCEEDEEDDDAAEAAADGESATEDVRATTRELAGEELLTPISPTAPAKDVAAEAVHGEMEQAADGDTQPARRAFPPRSRQLPFMTPIVEKTESSVGAMTAHAEKDYFSSKTPSRKNAKTPLIPELGSSPFQAMLEEEKENLGQKVPALEFRKANVGKAHLRTARPAVKDVGERQSGPIVKDARCNPIDESIRNTILEQALPALETYPGYFDHRDQLSAQGAEIRKYTKSVKGKSDKTASLTAPTQLRLTDSDRQYTVRRELGKGAFAPVYLVDTQVSSDGDGEAEARVRRLGQGDHSSRTSSQEAVKMEEPPSAWEFYILRQAKQRLGISRAAASIVDAYEMHLYRDEGFLIEDYRNQGTLLDLVNTCRADGAPMDESLVLFFAVELLRTLEALHANGILHGDLKADNVLVRLDPVPDHEWDPVYSPLGHGGWAAKGLTLIDFGRGIDMRAFRPDVAFIADWKTGEADCAEMRELRPWTFQVDYHGLAGILHSLLFGKYLETVAERNGGPDEAAGARLGACRYKIREGLKRYWQTEIWAELFDMLLNPLARLREQEEEEGGKMPLLRGLRRVREDMEQWLVENCERGVGLKAGLRRMEAAIRERRR